MEKRLVHRGPDAGGVFVDGPVALVNRRLRIIDVAGPDQPLFNEDRSIAVVMNGEIYNYQDLRRDLLDKGHNLQTSGDTECLVHLYEEYGIEGCLSRLNGMFAFALYDSRQKKLHIARDRLGIKPLYVTETSRTVAFASELKALRVIPGFDARLCERALLDALVLRYIPGHHSIFQGVRQLPPGSYMVMEAEREPSVHSYWDVSFEDPDHDSNATRLADLEDHIERAVRRRMIAEVPLGTFLSGGLDSAYVVSEVARQAETKPLAITVGFANASIDERPAARELASILSVRHEEEEVHPTATGVLEDIFYYFDEPFFDSSSLPTYLLCEAARRHVTVVLSGDGGDENFAGYRRYKFDLLENQIRSLVPSALRGAVFGGLARLYPKGDFLPRLLRAKTLLSNVARDPLEAYVHSVSQMTPSEARSLLAPEIERGLRDYSPLDAFRGIYNRAKATDPLSKIQYLDFKTWLPDDILTKVDRASMAHSLEARVPLLDHELVERAARFPWRCKLRGGQGKWIFRELIKKRLPENILNRPKQGFHLPVDEWFKGELQEPVMQAAKCPLLNKDVVHKAVKQHTSGLRNRSAALWSVLVLDQWYRHWGDGKIPEERVPPLLREARGVT